MAIELAWYYICWCVILASTPATGSPSAFDIFAKQLIEKQKLIPTPVPSSTTTKSPKGTYSTGHLNIITPPTSTSYKEDTPSLAHLLSKELLTDYSRASSQNIHKQDLNKYGNAEAESREHYETLHISENVMDSERITEEVTNSSGDADDELYQVYQQYSPTSPTPSTTVIPVALGGAPISDAKNKAHLPVTTSKKAISSQKEHSPEVLPKNDTDDATGNINTQVKDHHAVEDNPTERSDLPRGEDAKIDEEINERNNKDDYDYGYDYQDYYDYDEYDPEYYDSQYDEYGDEKLDYDQEDYYDDKIVNDQVLLKEMSDNIVKQDDNESAELMDTISENNDGGSLKESPKESDSESLQMMTDTEQITHTSTMHKDKEPDSVLDNHLEKINEKDNISSTFNTTFVPLLSTSKSSKIQNVEKGPVKHDDITISKHDNTEDIYNHGEYSDYEQISSPNSAPSATTTLTTVPTAPDVTKPPRLSIYFPTIRKTAKQQQQPETKSKAMDSPTSPPVTTSTSEHESEKSFPEEVSSTEISKQEDDLNATQDKDTEYDIMEDSAHLSQHLSDPYLKNADFANEQQGESLQGFGIYEDIRQKTPYYDSLYEYYDRNKDEDFEPTDSDISTSPVIEHAQVNVKDTDQKLDEVEAAKLPSDIAIPQQSFDEKLIKPTSSMDINSEEMEDSAEQSQHLPTDEPQSKIADNQEEEYPDTHGEDYVSKEPIADDKKEEEYQDPDGEEYVSTEPIADDKEEEYQDPQGKEYVSKEPIADAEEKYQDPQGKEYVSKEPIADDQEQEYQNPNGEEYVSKEPIADDQEEEEYPDPKGEEYVSKEPIADVQEEEYQDPQGKEYVSKEPIADDQEEEYQDPHGEEYVSKEPIADDQEEEEYPDLKGEEYVSKEPIADNQEEEEFTDPKGEDYVSKEPIADDQEEEEYTDSKGEDYVSKEPIADAQEEEYQDPQGEEYVSKKPIAEDQEEEEYVYKGPIAESTMSQDSDPMHYENNYQDLLSHDMLPDNVHNGNGKEFTNVPTSEMVPEQTIHDERAEDVKSHDLVDVTASDRHVDDMQPKEVPDENADTFDETPLEYPQEIPLGMMDREIPSEQDRVGMDLLGNPENFAKLIPNFHGLRDNEGGEHTESGSEHDNAMNEEIVDYKSTQQPPMESAFTKEKNSSVTDRSLTSQNTAEYNAGNPRKMSGQQDLKTLQDPDLENLNTTAESESTGVSEIKQFVENRNEDVDDRIAVSANPEQEYNTPSVDNIWTPYTIPHDALNPSHISPPQTQNTTFSLTKALPSQQPFSISPFITTRLQENSEPSTTTEASIPSKDQVPDGHEHLFGAYIHPTEIDKLADHLGTNKHENDDGDDEQFAMYVPETTLDPQHYYPQIHPLWPELEQSSEPSLGTGTKYPATTSRKPEAEGSTLNAPFPSNPTSTMPDSAMTQSTDFHPSSTPQTDPVSSSIDPHHFESTSLMLDVFSSTSTPMSIEHHDQHHTTSQDVAADNHQEHSEMAKSEECVDPVIMLEAYPGHAMYGGDRQDTLLSEQECLWLCGNLTDCTAADYHKSEGSCFVHYGDSEYERQANPCCNHHVKEWKCAGECFEIHPGTYSTVSASHVHNNMTQPECREHCAHNTQCTAFQYNVVHLTCAIHSTDTKSSNGNDQNGDNGDSSNTNNDSINSSEQDHSIGGEDFKRDECCNFWKKTICYGDEVDQVISTTSPPSTTREYATLPDAPPLPGLTTVKFTVDPKASQEGDFVMSPTSIIILAGCAAFIIIGIIALAVFIAYKRRGRRKKGLLDSLNPTNPNVWISNVNSAAARNLMAYYCQDSSVDDNRNTFPKSVKPPGSPTYAHSDYELRPISRMTPYHDCSCTTHSDDFSWHDASTNNHSAHASHTNPHPHHNGPAATHPVLAHRTEYPTFPYVAASTRPQYFPTASRRLTRYDPTVVGGQSYLNVSYKDEFGESDKFYRGTSAYP